MAHPNAGCEAGTFRPAKTASTAASRSRRVTFDGSRLSSMRPAYRKTPERSITNACGVTVAFKWSAASKCSSLSTGIPSKPCARACSATSAAGSSTDEYTATTRTPRRGNRATKSRTRAL